MHHTLTVSRMQAGRRLGADPQDLLHQQRAIAIDPRLQRLTGNVLHNQVRCFAVRVDIVNGHDMFVNHRCRRA